MQCTDNLLHGTARTRSVRLHTDSRDSLRHGHPHMRQQRSSHIQHRPYHKSHPGQSPITWFFPSASSITRISTHIPQILPRWTSQALSTLVFLQTTSSVLVPSRLLMQQLKLLFLVCDVVQILLHASLLAYLRLSEWPSVLLQVFIIVLPSPIDLPSGHLLDILCNLRMAAHEEKEGNVMIASYLGRSISLGLIHKHIHQYVVI